eukprot:TRINITY_DN1316_c2_g2_i1.p1 TRINITY_DN1316_c2_g2~~TRINITY_DN1316_c2_g2_i1.p1  ORF type:complete len:269 (+),score=61.04 TRINITY_DN1316_c2_g2_i1:70-807(+)
MTPYHPPYSTPPAVALFRDGIDKTTKEGEISVAKQFFKEYISAMHTGRVAECFDAWLDDKAAYVVKEPCATLQARGKTGACKLYNMTVDEITSLSVSVNAIKYNKDQRVAVLDVASSTVKDSGLHPVAQNVRFTFKFNVSMKLSKLVTSCQPTQSAVYPVVVESSSSLPLKPPTSHRPCAHNNWDHIRVKRHQALLRCRECASQWKIAVGKIAKCYRHLSLLGCPNGDGCTSLHINHRKQGVAGQ